MAAGVPGLLVVDRVDVGDLEAAGVVGLDVRVQILPRRKVHRRRGRGEGGGEAGAEPAEVSAVRAETGMGIACGPCAYCCFGEQWAREACGDGAEERGGGGYWADH